jgi:hypothetical protein
MDSKRVNAIITEAINKVINEDFMGEKKNDSDSNIGGLINKYLEKHPKKKKSKKRLRRKINGGKEYYDYDDYEKKNVKVSLGDANSIRSSIDTERTNIAAIARDFFPDHTDEGAQSQFRKIINGERPMTKSLASKIEKYIAKGKIATK